MRSSAASLACSLAVLACAPATNAHPGAPGTGFQSRVSLIRPAVPGLFVDVLGGDELLSVRNWSPKTVVLHDPNGRPFLRLDNNVVSRDDGAGWRVVERGRSYAWHDPRIHATGPPPEREGLVRNWRISGAADGKPFTIVGFLGYRPPPGATEDGDGGLPVWAIALAAAGGAFVLAAALALPLRRREGGDERRDTATE